MESVARGPVLARFVVWLSLSLARTINSSFIALPRCTRVSPDPEVNVAERIVDTRFRVFDDFEFDWMVRWVWK